MLEFILRGLKGAMFGKKKEEYTQDFSQMSEAQLANRFPQIANIKIANENLSQENFKLEEANAALQEELAKYKALYEEAKKGQTAPANTSSTSAYLDTRIWEENKRLTNEIKDLKTKLASCNSNTAPDTNSNAELATLRKELNWANDHAKNLENALYNERAENAELKDKLNNGGNRMSNEVTQWEYKTVNSHDATENPEELNRYGKEGWEVTGISNAGNGYACEKIILKRPKQRDNDYGYSR